MTRQKQNRDFLNVITINGVNLSSPDLEGVWLDEATLLVPSPYGTLTLTVRKANKRGLEKAALKASGAAPALPDSTPLSESQEPQGQDVETAQIEDSPEEPEMVLAPESQDNEEQELEEVVEEEVVEEEEEEDEFSLLEAQILGRPAPTPQIEEEQDEFYDL